MYNGDHGDSLQLVYVIIRSDIYSSLQHAAVSCNKEKFIQCDTYSLAVFLWED